MKFLVTLSLHIGEYEKRSKQLIEAPDALQAGTKALEGECHGQPDWAGIDPVLKQKCWDRDEMVYKVFKVKPIPLGDYEILKKYF